MIKTFSHLLDNPSLVVKSKECLFYNNTRLNTINISPTNEGVERFNYYFEDMLYVGDKRNLVIDLLFDEQLTLEMGKISKSILAGDFLYEKHGKDAVQILNLYIDGDIKIKLHLADHTVTIPILYTNCTFNEYSPSIFYVNDYNGCAYVGS